MATTKAQKAELSKDVRAQVLAVSGASDLPEGLLVKAIEYRSAINVGETSVTIQKIRLFAGVCSMIDEAFTGKDVMRVLGIWSRAAGYTGSGSASVRDYAKLGVEESAKVLEAYSAGKITQKSAILIARGVTHRSKPIDSVTMDKALKIAEVIRSKGMNQPTTLDKLLGKSDPEVSASQRYAVLVKKIDALNTELQALEFDAISAGLKDRVIFTRTSNPVAEDIEQGASRASSIRQSVDHTSISAANVADDLDARIARGVQAAVKALGLVAPVQSTTPVAEPVKRGRGRPKGSTSSKAAPVA